MDDAWLLQIEVANDGVKATCRDDTVESLFQVNGLRAQAIDIFIDQLWDNRLTKVKEVQLLGTLLYEAVFNGEVERFLQARLAEYKRSRTSLARPVGSTDETPAGGFTIELLVRDQYLADRSHRLQDVPWEFMHGPTMAGARPVYLSTSQDVIFRRQAFPVEEWKELEQLRLLLVVSQPLDLCTDLIDGESEAKRLESAIRGLGSDRLELCKVLLNPTKDELDAALEAPDTSPDALHYLGYGSAGDGGAIALCDGNHAARWITHSEFADGFQNAAHRPRLVFLHLCPIPTTDGASPTPGGGDFASLAQELSRVPIQAAVGMRYPVALERDTFTPRFYETVLRLGSVTRAMQEWRKRALAEISAMGSAVLYTSADRLMTPALELASAPEAPSRQDLSRGQPTNGREEQPGVQPTTLGRHQEAKLSGKTSEPAKGNWGWS